MPRRLAFTTVAILVAIARGHRFGLAIMRETGLPSGTVYPALARAEDAGLVRGRWEVETARDPADNVGRPPRRYYELTRTGAAALDVARDRLTALTGHVEPIRGK